MEVKIRNEVASFIREKKLLSDGDTVVAGVSGGADSMCMLCLLMDIGRERGIKLVVAHVDHGIRGDEAEADAAFVRDFCEKRGIEFRSVKADILKLSEDTGTSCEEAGRNFRYAFFMETAAKTGAKAIAVAHNSGDNAETVLFNLFRGTGISGMKGILPKRTLTDAGGNSFLLIRPILCLSRSRIEEYLSAIGQEYRTDRTNLTEDYSRNRIRNSILKEVKEHINSNVEGHIESMSLQAAEIEDYLFGEADKYMSLVKRRGSYSLELKSEGLAILHPVIRRIIIRRAFEMVSGRLKDVEETHILAIEGLFAKQSGRSCNLPYGIIAEKEYGLVILKKSKTEEEPLKNTKVVLKVLERYMLEDEIPCGQEEKWFDYDKAGDGLKLRNIEQGDYLLIGKELHKKSLSRYMIDKKIPKAVRERTLLLTKGSHVLWVVGYRQDESCLVTEDTKRVLVARIEKVES